ncbi:MAG: DNA adenine methylase [Chloroflexota bacterium]|nr:DNA adenine methylase [Chloroflexota bacterium]
MPQRSPFRYPGGKTWLVPHLRRWLASRPQRPAVSIEPFAGGGIVSLTVAAEQLADHALMVELDPHVAAVWQTILQDPGGGEWLAERIVRFDLTAPAVETALHTPAINVRERAFQTILRNRVNRGGILAEGAGRIKRGEADRGLASRWYPDTLKRRILDILTFRSGMGFIHGDGLAVLRQWINRADAVFFIDPPYTVAGKKAGSRLYTHSELDHEELFRLASALQGDFLMTYDNAAGVRQLAQRYGFSTHAVAMKNTHHAEMTELLIGRDLRWVGSHS